MKIQLLKKLCVAAIGIMGVTSFANAQGHWLASVSGPGALFPSGYPGNRLAVDADGHTYTVGAHSTAVGFYGVGNTGTGGTATNTFNTTGTNSKSFIVKTKSGLDDGKIDWTLGLRNSGTSVNVVAYTIAVSDVGTNGAVYVGGFFNGSINSFSGFSPTPATVSAPTGEAGFVTKVSKTGAYGWTKVFDGTGNQRITGVVTDSQGNLIVIGLYSNTLTITGTTNYNTTNIPAITATSGTDAFIAKFDADGELLFIKSIGGRTGTETIWGVAADVNNSVYVAGNSGADTLSVSGDSLKLGTGTNSYLAKFDYTGTFKWARAIVANQSQTAYALTVDTVSVEANRGVYLTGYVNSTSTDPLIDNSINFAGKTITPDNTANSPFAAKFNAANGNGILARVFNAGSTSYGYVISINSNKELFVGGYANDNINIGIGGVNVPTQNSGEDGFIVKLDSDDELKTLDYKMIATNSGTDRVLGLATTSSAVYVAGMAAGGTAVPETVNFAGTGYSFLYRGGSWDAFIMKWNSTTLPVSLTDFKGSKTTSGNQLSWNTVSESNNKHFELERSADAVNFTSIQTINTKAVSGNSTAKLSYSYTDANPLAGVNYYRLKQVDNDGKFAYSENVVALNNSLSESDEVKIYPNPGSGNITIRFSTASAGRELNVYNQAGQLVKSYAEASGSSHVIDITAQPTGIYFIQVLEKGKSNLIKYIKQ